MTDMGFITWQVCGAMLTTSTQTKGDDSDDSSLARWTDKDTDRHCFRQTPQTGYHNARQIDIPNRQMI